MSAPHQHVLVALLEDRPGALNRVVSLFRRRSFNIESLTVGHTETPGISRLTMVIDGATTIVEQVVKQLYKVVDVVKVSDLTHEESVHRELALIKVAATASTRADLTAVVELFRGKVVDVAPDSLIIEATGSEDKIESMISMLRSYGIKEMVRTGRISMLRGIQGTTRIPEEPVQLKKYRVMTRSDRHATAVNDI